jgi:hypothetical protein
MQTNYESIHNALFRTQLLRCQAPSYDCHDSLFESICFLLGEYDMMSLRKCASQTFCNAYLGQKTFAIECLQKHLLQNVSHNAHSTTAWQTYVINMSIPYIEGKVEGGNFSLQWISHMLNIDIQIWSTESQSFTQRFHSGYRPSKQLFLLHDTSQWPHMHYQPLIQEQSPNQLYDKILDNQT